jgi:hypothetical protein
MDIIDSIVESLKTEEGLSYRIEEGMLFLGGAVIYDGDLFRCTALGEGKKKGLIIMYDSADREGYEVIKDRLERHCAYEYRNTHQVYLVSQQESVQETQVSVEEA